MATGKTNERWIEITWDSDDLSAYFDTVNGVGLDYQADDVTGFANAVMAHTLNHPRHEVTLAGPFSTQLWALNGDLGVETGKTLLVDFGVRAAPTTGDPRFSATNMMLSSFLVNNNRITLKLHSNYAGTAPTFTTVS